MATTPMPQPDQGGSPQAGGPPQPPPQGGSQQGPPSGGQANDLQKLLAQWYTVSKQMAQSDPRLAEGAELVAQGVQKMQTALVTPPQSTPMSQQPQY